MQVTFSNEGNNVCNDPFFNKDSRVRAALPCLLAILVNQEAGVLKADSITDAAGKCVDMMQKPGMLGRRLDQRIEKMRQTIEAAIKLGYVTYSGRECRLELTSRGRLAIDERRKRFERESYTRRQLANA